MLLDKSTRNTRHYTIFENHRSITYGKGIITSDEFVSSDLVTMMMMMMMTMS